MTPRCSNPRCSRRAKVITSDADPVWEHDDGNAPTCVPCYVAFVHGTKRHPPEVGFERIDGEPLKEADRGALKEAY